MQQLQDAARASARCAAQGGLHGAAGRDAGLQDLQAGRLRPVHRRLQGPGGTLRGASGHGGHRADHPGGRQRPPYPRPGPQGRGLGSADCGPQKGPGRDDQPRRSQPRHS